MMYRNCKSPQLCHNDIFFSSHEKRPPIPTTTRMTHYRTSSEPNLGTSLHLSRFLFLVSDFWNQMLAKYVVITESSFSFFWLHLFSRLRACRFWGVSFAWPCVFFVLDTRRKVDLELIEQVIRSRFKISRSMLFEIFELYSLWSTSLLVSLPLVLVRTPTKGWMSGFLLPTGSVFIYPRQ